MTATRSMSDEEIAASIASSYATFGPDDWNREDPYQVADWAAILTPAEFGAWQDIRAWGLPLWPRLPVGDFTISFGHPIARVALQCGDAHARRFAGLEWRAGAELGLGGVTFCRSKAAPEFCLCDRPILVVLQRSSTSIGFAGPES